MPVGARRAAVSVAGALALGATAGLLLVSSGTTTGRGGDVVLAYKWKGYKEPTNVFDDYDSDFKMGAWKDYKAPSNVFDSLPELANADHKVSLSLCVCLSLCLSPPHPPPRSPLLRPAGRRRCPVPVCIAGAAVACACVHTRICIC